jgi:hypothetical protein
MRLSFSKQDFFPMYIGAIRHMLRPTCILVNDGHMEKLTALAESRGLKCAQLVRLAIVEFLRRETRKR